MALDRTTGEPWVGGKLGFWRVIVEEHLRHIGEAAGVVMIKPAEQGLEQLLALFERQATDIVDGWRPDRARFAVRQLIEAGGGLHAVGVTGVVIGQDQAIERLGTLTIAWLSRLGFAHSAASVR